MVVGRDVDSARVEARPCARRGARYPSSRPSAAKTRTIEVPRATGPWPRRTGRGVLAGKAPRAVRRPGEDADNCRRAAEYAYGPTGGRLRVPHSPAARGALRRTRCDLCVAPGSRYATSIVRVFDTELSLRAALKAGLDAHAVHITPAIFRVRRKCSEAGL